MVVGLTDAGKKGNGEGVGLTLARPGHVVEADIFTDANCVIARTAYSAFADIRMLRIVPPRWCR